MTFLAIDCGNTRLKWALYAAPHPGAVLLQQGAAFLETIDELAESQWKDLPEPHSMLGCVVHHAPIYTVLAEHRWRIYPEDGVTPG